MAKRQSKEKFLVSEQHRVPPLLPLTEKQGVYISTILTNDVTVSTGYAGTGKTFIAATIAADLYRNHVIDEIILTRPNVASGKSLGFFPGSLEEKMDPWMRPLTSRMRSRLGAGVYDTAVKAGNIRVEPFETMRGASFNAFVILDEAQNTTPEEMLMFLTRFESGKIVVNGDIRQSDLKSTSGLKTLVGLCTSGKLSIPVIDFDSHDDIVRSGLVKDVIIAFDSL